MSTGLGLNIIKTLDRAAKDRLYGATNEDDAVSAGNEWTVKAVFGVLRRSNSRSCFEVISVRRGGRRHHVGAELSLRFLGSFA